MSPLVHAILRHHGLEGECVRSPREGVANEVWLCGPVVVRVATDPEYLEDFYTESVAAPVAFAHGILTPKPIAYDASKTVVPVEYSIVERVHGVQLAEIQELADPRSFFRDYGAIVRRIHDRVSDVPDPEGWLDEAWIITPESLRTDYPTFDFGDLLSGLDGEAPIPQVFVHQDLHAENVLVHEGKLSAILDWGDAGWGDPAVDLRFVPIRWMHDALEGYGPIDDLGILRRIALHALDHFLDGQDDGKNYGPYGGSTWDELVAFLQRVKARKT